MTDKPKPPTKVPTNRELLQRRRKPERNAWEGVIATDEQLITRLRSRAGRMIEYIDDKAMAAASLKDLVAATKSIIELERLLANQPTAIVSVEHRMKIAELLPKLLTEAQRRGMTIDLPTKAYHEVAGGH